jgi:hypothetical protein
MEQMRALERAARRKFERNLRSHLRAKLREHHFTFTEETLDEYLFLGLGRASDLAIRTEVDVARFLELVAILMGGFGPEPFPAEANRILSALSVPPNERLDRFNAWAASYRRDLSQTEADDAIFE